MEGNEPPKALGHGRGRFRSQETSKHGKLTRGIREWFRIRLHEVRIRGVLVLLCPTEVSQWLGSPCFPKSPAGTLQLG